MMVLMKRTIASFLVLAALVTNGFAEDFAPTEESRRAAAERAAASYEREASARTAAEMQRLKSLADRPSALQALADEEAAQKAAAQAARMKEWEKTHDAQGNSLLPSAFQRELQEKMAAEAAAEAERKKRDYRERHRNLDGSDSDVPSAEETARFERSKRHVEEIEKAAEIKKAREAAAFVQAYRAQREEEEKTAAALRLEREAFSRLSPGEQLNWKLSRIPGVEDGSGRLSGEARRGVKELLSHDESINCVDPAFVLTIARVRGPLLGDWAQLYTWLDDPRRRPAENPDSPLYALYSEARDERHQVDGKLSGCRPGAVPSALALARNFQQWLDGALANGAAAAPIGEGLGAFLLVDVNGDRRPDLNMLGYDPEAGYWYSRALLLLSAERIGDPYDPNPWLRAVAAQPRTLTHEVFVAQLAASVQKMGEMNFGCLDALGRMAGRWHPARNYAQMALGDLKGILLLGDGKAHPTCLAARIAWERVKQLGNDDADTFAHVYNVMPASDEGWGFLATAAARSDMHSMCSGLILEYDPAFEREVAAAVAAGHR